MHINFPIIWYIHCMTVNQRLHTIQDYTIPLYEKKITWLCAKRNPQRERRKIPAYQTRDTSSIRKRRLIPSCPAADRSELCQRFPGDSAFSTVVPRPSVASQGRHRLARRPAMTGRTSRISCLFETSTSSSDHERVQLSDSLRALRGKGEWR